MNTMETRIAWGFKPKAGAKARGLGWEQDVCPTLNCEGAGMVAIVELLTTDENVEKDISKDLKIKKEQQ